MAKSSRRLPVIPLLVGISALGVLGTTVFAFMAGALDSSPVLPSVYSFDSTPDRFTKILLDGDAGGEGEGERAKREEGRAGKKDAKLRRSVRESLESVGYVGDNEVSGNGGLSSRGSGTGGGAVGDLSVRRSALEKRPQGLTAAKGTARPTVAEKQEQPRDRHQDHGTNPFTLTATDRHSTFAADVDTASYTQARGRLNAGVLPVPSSVRVEEFVNAQDYGYATPTDDAPFAVHLEAAPHPWTAGRTLLRVGVKGEEIDVADAPPVHLTFLVDVSGSMSSARKLPLVKTALHTLVANLGDDDTVAVVTYAGATEVLLEPTSAGRSDRLHEVISGLGAGGSTDMGSGVDLAYQLARAVYVEGHENRVIVLSDGDANVGDTSHTAILNRIEEHAANGVTLTTVGFGQGNYNDTLMEQLADKGDGAAFYIDSAAEARHRFSGELTGTLRTIAKDVKLQVEFNPSAVHSYRLVGYENRDVADRDFRNDAVDAGELGSGHQVTALYELILADDGATELATVRVRARAPGPDKPAREWATVLDTSQVRAELSEASPGFRKAVAVAGFAEVLRGSRYAQELSLSDVYRLAADAVTQEKRDQELLGLIAIAGSLSGETITVARR